MGKGDVKTKRGKITKGTYGVRRPKSQNQKALEVVENTKKSTAKKKPITKKEK
ncbi:MAG: 30S ribosomal protein THX [Bacteroidota bacterium]